MGNYPGNRGKSIYTIVQLLESAGNQEKHAADFAEPGELIYPGLKMCMVSDYRKGSTTDTLLVTSKFISKGYPGTSIIYNQIEKLKKISGSKGVSITGNPLINISNISSSDYQVMVALPVNKLFSSGDSVVAKRMIPGKFIVAEVKGGSYQVMNTLEQIKLYAQDYGRSPVAIPFEYLLTDRQQEPDSNKWVTKIYLPVY